MTGGWSMWMVSHHKIVEQALHIVYGRAFPNYWLMYCLRTGSAWPDGDKTGYPGSHHKYEKKNIKKHILNARNHFLSEDYDESAFQLGLASHFIADRTCPDSQNEKHDKWERNAYSSSLVSNAYKINARLQKLTTYEDIDSTINKAVLQQSEDESVRTSINLCASLMELTWRPLDRKSRQEQVLIEKAQQSYSESTSPISVKDMNILYWYRIIECPTIPKWGISEYLSDMGYE